MIEPTTARTHDFTCRGWGRNLEVLRIFEKGQNIDMCGWCGEIPRVGDYVVFTHSGVTSRYRITSIKQMTDPPDQWFAKAVFDPRTAGKDRQ